MTADELLALPRDGYRYELIKGKILRMSPAGSEHGMMVVNFTVPLAHHVKQHQLGIVFGAETGFKIARDPDTVRAPDVAFARRERIPEGGVPKGYWLGAPDLAIEIISLGNTYTEVEDKVKAWLEAGAQMVIVANPRNRTLKVHRSLTDLTVLAEADTLDIPDVVAGFRCVVADLFA